MITINGECKSISRDALKDIKEAGKVFKLKVLDKSHKESENLSDKFNDFYGQNNMKDLVYNCEYNVHGLLSYATNNDKREGQGLSEQCNLSITLTTYELINNGFFSEVDTIGDIPVKFKRQSMISIDDIVYSIVNVDFQAIYLGFPILIVLSCIKYDKGDKNGN